MVGPDDTVYGWADNQSGLIRWEGDTIEALPGPGGDPGIYAVVVDPQDPLHLRVGAAGGLLSESFDGGDSFQKLGNPPPTDQALGYEVAFDPTDIDRVIAGFVNEGWYISDDAGTTWEQAQVDTMDPDQPINGFAAVFAPDGSGVVYAQGLEVELGDSPRWIYRSEDHGFTFEPVIPESPETLMTNGIRMFVSPTNPDRMLWSVGTCLQGAGTHIYAYDHGLKEVIWSQHDYAEFNAITFSPASSSFVYLGIEGSGNPNGPQCSG
ncbi:MAG: hypothetical protein HC927_09485 [Deltaproteobacteria bacterium]|nr:hypothetical protein [Deltaproteobacteria bacterium]